MLELTIYPFAAIGALFVVMQAIGHALNGLQAWIALDQWVATCCIAASTSVLNGSSIRCSGTSITAPRLTWLK